MTDWIIGKPNNVLESKDKNFYISYVSKDADIFKGTMWCVDGAHPSETALIWRNPWKCLILNGDFRKEYEELLPKGYEACLEFYKKNIALRSSWSEDQTDEVN